MRRGYVQLTILLVLGVLISLGLFLGGGLLSVGSFLEEGSEPYDPALPSGITPGLWGVTGGFTLEDGGVRFDRSLVLRDLYFDRFLTEYEAVGSWGSRSKSCGGVFAVVNGDRYRLSGSNGNAERGTGCVSRGRFEIRWDSFEESVAQVFVDGVRRGVVNVSTESLRLEFVIENGPTAGTVGNVGSVWFGSPSVVRVFGCDLMEGEVVESVCVEGPESIRTSDLDGFERFCLDHPAKFLRGGVSSGSKQVYYSLARGERLDVESGEAWEFSYIARDDRIGDGVGLASSCVEPVVVEDEIDITYGTSLDSSTSFEWVASRDGSRITSGGSVLLEAFKPEYLCRDSDGHDPAGDVIEFPNPSLSCWEPSLSLDPNFWSAGLNDMAARVRYGGGDGSGLVRDDEWVVSYDVRLKETPVRVLGVSGSGAGVGESGVLRVELLNEYVPLDGVVHVQYRPRVLNAPVTYQEETNLLRGSQFVSVPLDARFEGSVDGTATVFMVTNAGNLQASDSFRFSYVVGEDSSVVEERSGFSSLILRIKDWFRRLFT